MGRTEHIALMGRYPAAASRRTVSRDDGASDRLRTRETTEMSTVHLYLDGHREADLTADHALSSYGQPVLVVDGTAYGPLDHVGGRMACHLVATSATEWETDHLWYDPLPGEPDARDDETRLADELRARYTRGTPAAAGQRWPRV